MEPSSDFKRKKTTIQALRFGCEKRKWKSENTKNKTNQNNNKHRKSFDFFYKKKHTHTEDSCSFALLSLPLLSH